jgi:hypothetical protein
METRPYLRWTGGSVDDRPVVPYLRWTGGSLRPVDSVPVDRWSVDGETGGQCTGGPVVGGRWDRWTVHRHRCIPNWFRVILLIPCDSTDSVWFQVIPNDSSAAESADLRVIPLIPCDSVDSVWFQMIPVLQN